MAGRRRKPDPSIPAHIDQSAIPKGIYWNKRGRGNWYVFTTNEAGKATTLPVAGADALLSDLHEIAEKRTDHAAGTLAWLCGLFEESTRFKKLATSSQDSYKKTRRWLLKERTKQGGTVGELRARDFTRGLVQRLVDRIAKGTRRDDAGELVATPTKARHALRYLSVVFGWGANRDYCDGNPAQGVESPAEAKRVKMPNAQTMERVIAFARQQANDGRARRGQKQTCPPYLWAVAEIAYRCRLRGIEALTITDAQVLEDGLLCYRRKMSRTNLVEWSPSLRAAVDHLVEVRKTVRAKKRLPTHMDPAQRPLVVSYDGSMPTKSALDSAWNRMMHAAVDAGVISLEEKENFSLHGLKHRGITDTKGNRADKQQASGHRSAAMLETYDHEIHRVRPAGDPT